MWSNALLQARPAMKLDEVQRMLSKQLLNVSRDRDATPPLYNLFQHLTTPITRIISIISNGNLPSDCWWLYSFHCARLRSVWLHLLFLKASARSRTPFPPQAFSFPDWSTTAPDGVCTANWYSLTQVVVCGVDSQSACQRGMFSPERGTIHYFLMQCVFLLILWVLNYIYNFDEKYWKVLNHNSRFYFF